MKKIVMLAPFYEPVKGGMEAHVKYLSEALHALGHEVEVFTSDLSRDGKIPVKEEVINGIKVRRFPAWFKLGQFASLFPGIFSAVKNSDAAIFHAHNFRHPTNFIPYFTKKPCFLTWHWPDYPDGLRSKTSDKIVKVFDKHLAKGLMKKFTKHCAVSATEAPFIKSFGVPKEKMALTPNAIPKSYLEQADAAFFRRKYGFKEKDLLVLSLSRLHKSKGFDLIVGLAQKYPQVKFALVGKDEGFRPTLEKMIEERKVSNVHLIGEIPEDEKLRAFAACDIFIHPSHFEAFGIVALEAMAQKKAIITSDVGGLPWVVSDAGLIFKDNDLLDLEDKFKRLVYSAKMRKELAEKAFARASTLTWDRIAKHLSKIYEELE